MESTSAATQRRRRHLARLLLQAAANQHSKQMAEKLIRTWFDDRECNQILNSFEENVK